MLVEENSRKIKGASACLTSDEQDKTWPQRMNSMEFESCPEEYKSFIESTDLDELVYWKLKEKLEKQSPHKQNEILKGVLADVERPLITLIMHKVHGNQSRAAELLGCNRNTLHRKLKELFINPRDVKMSAKNGIKSKDPFLNASRFNS